MPINPCLSVPVAPVGGVDDDVDLALAVGGAVRLEARERREDAPRGQLIQVRLVRLVPRQVAQPRQDVLRVGRLVVERHSGSLRDGSDRVPD